MSKAISLTLLPDSIVQNSRVYEKDLVAINRTSVPLSDEKGGYLVTLDVFHQLHCLNIIRQGAYIEYYPERRAESDWDIHVDHCVDTLREVLMCHGDIALHTYTWKERYRRPWPNFNIDHECRKWASIHDWAVANNIDSLRGNILMHPTLGRWSSSL